MAEGKARLLRVLAEGDLSHERLAWVVGDRRPAAPAALVQAGLTGEQDERLSAPFIVGETYGTRASTVVALGHDGRGVIVERRWGPMGTWLGETRLAMDPSAG